MGLNLSNKRRLQDLRSKKKTKEQLLEMVVEGLPDDHTQSVIDDLIVKRKRLTVVCQWLK